MCVFFKYFIVLYFYSIRIKIREKLGWKRDRKRVVYNKKKKDYIWIVIKKMSFLCINDYNL